MAELIFPWWPKELKPNGTRPHWAAKAKAAKDYKTIAYIVAIGQEKPELPFTDDIDLEVIFHPKTKHKIDRDNCVAACKSLFDGLALAWHVDDSRFAITPRIGEPVKGGKVVVRYDNRTRI